MTHRDEFRDPRFERRYGARRAAPYATYPIPVGSKLRAVGCRHCSQPLGVSAWDRLNGFLVVCPHCGGYHGKAWSLERTLLAGLFLNVVSFFFILRPRAAVTGGVGFVVFAWALLVAAVRIDDLGPLMVVALGVIALGPPLINAAVLIRHQMLLDRAPPDDVGSLE